MGELVSPDSEQLTTPEACPCCYQTALPLGLFDLANEVPMPIPVQAMLMHDQRVDQINEDLLHAQGRFFCRLEAPLPLNKANSPVRVMVWAEISAKAADEFDSVMTSQLIQSRDIGRLACDLPGFPGTFGAGIYYEIVAEDKGRVLLCYDQRIQDLNPLASHQEMAGLYRKTWGNNDSVPDADLELRSQLNQRWNDVIGRPLYRKFITPPPWLAGITPTELLVSPPIDTGDEAMLATIGGSDVRDENGRATEFITWARNPSDKFIQAFSNFSYLSRYSSNLETITPGALITNGSTIPDTEDNLAGWLLWPPLLLDQEEFIFSKQTVDILSAIPVYPLEVNFAESFGIDALVEYLQEADIADLTRPLAVPTPEEMQD